MLLQTISIVKANVGFSLFILCFMIALLVFQDMHPDQRMGQVNTFLPIFVSYYVSKIIVENSNKISANMIGFWGFSVKSLVLIFTLIALSVAVYLSVVELGNDGGIPVLLIGFMAIVYVAAMSLLGTWPISSIGRIGTSLASALRRGGRRFFPIFGRMLLATLLPVIVGLSLSPMTGRLATSPAMFSDWGVTAFVVMLNALAGTINILSIIYAAVVLARVYADDEKDALEAQRMMSVTS